MTKLDIWISENTWTGLLLVASLGYLIWKYFKAWPNFLQAALPSYCDKNLGNIAMTKLSLEFKSKKGNFESFYNLYLASCYHYMYELIIIQYFRKQNPYNYFWKVSTVHYVVTLKMRIETRECLVRP